MFGNQKQKRVQQIKLEVQNLLGLLGSDDAEARAAIPVMRTCLEYASRIQLTHRDSLGSSATAMKQQAAKATGGASHGRNLVALMMECQALGTGPSLALASEIGRVVGETLKAFPVSFAAVDPPNAVKAEKILLPSMTNFMLRLVPQCC